MSTNISHFIGNFNPRSHEGSDQYLERVRSIDSEISIHAPTRGATTTSMGSNYLVNISIHAPTRGATNNKQFLHCVSSFQSTLPRGERRKECRHFHPADDFNPRSHEGSDLHSLGIKSVIRISIHAPTRGATTKRSTPLTELLFQSTLPRGERQYQ